MSHIGLKRRRRYLQKRVNEQDETEDTHRKREEKEGNEKRIKLI